MGPESSTTYDTCDKEENKEDIEGRERCGDTEENEEENKKGDESKKVEGGGKGEGVEVGVVVKKNSANNQKNESKDGINNDYYIENKNNKEAKEKIKNEKDGNEKIIKNDIKAEDKNTDLKTITKNGHKHINNHNSSNYNNNNNNRNSNKYKEIEKPPYKYSLFDCEYSQKIGFIKQLEFIYKLTESVDSLRYIERSLRTEKLLCDLIKMNENVPELGMFCFALYV